MPTADTLPKPSAIDVGLDVGFQGENVAAASLPKRLGLGKEEREGTSTAGSGDAKHDTARPKKPQQSKQPLDHPDFERLRLTLDEHCHDLQRDFDQILAHCPIAKETVKYIAQRIVPKAPVGKPRKQDINEAARLRAEGQPWRVIYVRLGKSSRDEQHALRAAIRQRNLRAKRRAKRDAKSVCTSCSA